MDIDEEGTKVLSALAQELGLSALRFDEEDTSGFALDQKMVIDLHLDRVTEEVVIGVTFGAMPEGRDDAGFLRRLLEANYYWRLTQGGTIGLDEKSGALTLCYRVPLPMQEPAQIGEIVAKLAGAAEHWSRRLSELGGNGPREIQTGPMLRA